MATMAAPVETKIEYQRLKYGNICGSRLISVTSLSLPLPFTQDWTLFVIAVASLEIFTENTLFNVHVLEGDTQVIPRSTTEKHSFPPLPGLDPAEEQPCGNENNAPFPSDAFMLEHNCVDDGNVEEGEKRDEATYYRPEQEPVAPDIVNPLGEIPLGAWLHPEKGPPHIDHLPGQEQSKPGEARKRGRSSVEH